VRRDQAKSVAGTKRVISIGGVHSGVVIRVSNLTKARNFRKVVYRSAVSKAEPRHRAPELPVRGLSLGHSCRTEPGSVTCGAFVDFSHIDGCAVYERNSPQHPAEYFFFFLDLFTLLNHSIHSTRPYQNLVRCSRREKWRMSQRWCLQIKVTS